MKRNGPYEPHLAIGELHLPPGAEQPWRRPNWSVTQIDSGCGYWLHGENHRPLESGSVLILAPDSTGSLRASQLGSLSLYIYSVDPMRLNGLMTIGEQGFLQTTASQQEFLARIFPPDHPTAAKLKKVRANGTTGTLSRVQLLEVFLETFGNALNFEPSQPKGIIDAKKRLQEFLDQISAADLLNLTFSDVVQAIGCTPRHFSRIFREIVGMSFRDKHAELRLNRACELLVATESKIVNVALDSGFQSLSLFNLMFARRFGMSPRQWRQKHTQSKTRSRRKPRLIVL